MNGCFQPIAELHTIETIVPKLTFALVARLVRRLTGLQRKLTVATVWLLEVQRVTDQRPFVRFAFAAKADLQRERPLG